MKEAVLTVWFLFDGSWGMAHQYPALPQESYEDCLRNLETSKVELSMVPGLPEFKLACYVLPVKA